MPQHRIHKIFNVTYHSFRIFRFPIYGWYFQIMSGNSANQLLEPRLSEDVNREKLVRNLLIEKPNIKRFERSGVLDQVKSFLPQMAEAEAKLSEALASKGSDKFDIENISGDDNVIEMDVALMKDEDKMIVSPERSWTSDSEDDSSQSPSENSFTSDTDISSSSTCSSSSCDESSQKSKSQR